MAITNIAVSNFKSFRQFDLNLGRFNVVIGANAAGKSNFAETFRFLRTVEENSVEDAILLHGGASSIRNVSLSSSRPLRIKVVSDREMAWGSGGPLVRVAETMYDFSLRWDDSSDGVIISDDHVMQRLQLGPARDGASADRHEAEITLEIWLADDRREVGLEPADVLARVKSDPRFSAIELYTSTLGPKVESWKAKTLLVRTRFFDLLPPEESLFGGLGVYSIDPHAIKKPFQVGGRTELQEDGANLPHVLKKVLEKEQESRRFHNLMRDVLPFAESAGTEQFPAKSLLLTLREGYNPRSLPAYLLSDGTINIVALLLAMYFERKELVIIEEPERNIHPRLISGLVDMMKDASRKKQIIVTTHSPEVVKHAGVENLLLISRDKEGFSTVSRPAEKEAVRVFLEHELGLDDLFVQDLLAVP